MQFVSYDCLALIEGITGVLSREIDKTAGKRELGTSIYFDTNATYNRIKEAY